MCYNRIESNSNNAYSGALLIRLKGEGLNMYRNTCKVDLSHPSPLYISDCKSPLIIPAHFRFMARILKGRGNCTKLKRPSNLGG